MVHTINLQGLWQLAFGGEAPPKAPEHKIMLPATTESAGLGEPALQEAQTEHLCRLRPYTGPAWYLRSVQIPEGWRGRDISLWLERTKLTSVWVDGVRVSESRETIVPQRHPLGAALTPGTHTLAICVDNNLAAAPDFPASLLSGHQYTDHTQTNWNGIVGGLRLEARPALHITGGKAVGSVKTGSIRLELELQNGGAACEAQLCARPTRVLRGESTRLPGRAFTLTLQPGENHCSVELPVEKPEPWDEFHPAYYDVALGLEAAHELDVPLEQAVAPERKVALEPDDSLGQAAICTLRAAFVQYSVQGRTLRLNGNPLSLRGTVDCAIYPRTGFAPTTVEAWLDILGTMQDYGLNHYRFHSWCPCDAAFEAADRLGMYLQVELPGFAACLAAEGEQGHDPVLNRFMQAQAHRLLGEYGNHPSLVVFALGNEMVGNLALYQSLVAQCRAWREDKLYTQGANNFLETQLYNPRDDLWIIMRTDSIHNIRASFSHNDPPLGHLQLGGPPGTMAEYGKALEISPLPLVAHEVGQYQVFPNLDEAADYTGPLYPTVYGVVERDLRQKGLLHLAGHFVNASGRLAAQCYREDIEALLRTRGMGGFQLLGLQDFPGQGTAMVGMLDSFLRSKGLISPGEWRRFCAPQVLLARFAAYTHFAGQEMPVELLAYNYGDALLAGEPRLEIWQDGEVLARHTLPQVAAQRGTLSVLGGCTLALPKLERPARLELRVCYAGLENDYPLWVYPRRAPVAGDGAGSAAGCPPVVVSGTLGSREAQALERGETLVLFSAGAKEEGSVEGFFTPDFWCWPMFKRACEDTGKPVAPGTMGLLVDAQHPALAAFPTRQYAEWQWHPLAHHARPVRLDRLNPGIEPVVRVIDNFSRNHSLALVLEARVAKGRLLLVASDVLRHLEKPEVQALYNSVVEYAAHMPMPQHQIPLARLTDLFA